MQVYVCTLTRKPYMGQRPRVERGDAHFASYGRRVEAQPAVSSLIYCAQEVHKAMNLHIRDCTTSRDHVKRWLS